MHRILEDLIFGDLDMNFKVFAKLIIMVIVIFAMVAFGYQGYEHYRYSQGTPQRVLYII